MKKLIILIPLLLALSFSQEICSNIYSPFKYRSRDKYQPLHDRTISVYGAHRNSYQKGHKHSGIDILGENEETIYSIGKGIVFNIHLSFPHLTLIIEHTLPGGQILYSCYKHVEDILVEVGEEVDENTPLARLFTQEEQNRARFQVNHLHFEIRTNFRDYGSASWTSMSMHELNIYFQDPLKFFKKWLKK